MHDKNRLTFNQTKHYSKIPSTLSDLPKQPNVDKNRIMAVIEYKIHWNITVNDFDYHHHLQFYSTIYRR